MSRRMHIVRSWDRKEADLGEFGRGVCSSVLALRVVGELTRDHAFRVVEKH